MPIEAKIIDNAVVNGNMKSYSEPNDPETIDEFSDEFGEGNESESKVESDPDTPPEEAIDENRGKATTIDIEVEFSEEELTTLAEQITAMDSSIDKLESEMDGYKRSATRLKKEIEEQDNERRALSRKYRVGKEVQTLSVRRVENYEDGVIEYYGIPSGKLVHTEPVVDGGLFDKSVSIEVQPEEQNDEVEDNDNPFETTEPEEVEELEEVEN
ncbi:MAG: hypothetical protein KGZ71_09970 [Desulfobulbaceae bacterium]|nr:hypothetical protein [Desulfobulbaceae bacterium]